MFEQITVFVDYVGNSKYGIFIEDPLKENPDHIMHSASASLSFISKKYGDDTHVEISHCAEVIFKVENGIDINKGLS